MSESKKTTLKKYPPELREHAVRLVREAHHPGESELSPGAGLRQKNLQNKTTKDGGCIRPKKPSADEKTREQPH